MPDPPPYRRNRRPSASRSRSAGSPAPLPMMNATLGQAKMSGLPCEPPLPSSVESLKISTSYRNMLAKENFTHQGSTSGFMSSRKVTKTEGTKAPYYWRRHPPRVGAPDGQRTPCSAGARPDGASGDPGTTWTGGAAIGRASGNLPAEIACLLSDRCTVIAWGSG